MPLLNSKLGYFHHKAITNNVAMNAHISVPIQALTLDTYVHITLYQHLNFTCPTTVEPIKQLFKAVIPM